jgi:hypothetical protein
MIEKAFQDVKSSVWNKLPRSQRFDGCCLGQQTGRGKSRPVGETILRSIVDFVSKSSARISLKNGLAYEQCVFR